MSHDTHPAAMIDVRKDIEDGDHIDSITLAIAHVRNTVLLVEMTLNADNNPDANVPDPSVLAATLHGVETHLSIIEKLAHDGLVEQRKGKTRRAA